MRQLLPLFAFMLVSVSLTGQDRSSNLVPFADQGQWGYMNAEKQIVIKAQYDAASFFELHLNHPNGKLARIKKDGKFGVIDQHGQIILPLQYDSIARYALRSPQKACGIIYDQDSTYYFTPEGKILPTLPPEIRIPTWVCLNGMDNECITLSVEKNLPFLDSANTFNHQYTSRRIDIENGQPKYKKEELSVNLDSIYYISSFYNSIKAEVMYRNDAKISIGQATYRNPVLPSKIEMGFIYDEVILTNCPLNIYKQFSDKLNVRIGNRWGVLDLSRMLNNRTYVNYKTSWHILPVKYLQIISKESDYYYVEYAPGQFGYVKPSQSPFGKHKEYWLDD